MQFHVLGRQPIVTLCAVAVVVLVCNQSAWAQFGRNSAVGGVDINAEGVLRNPEVHNSDQLLRVWQNALGDVPQKFDKKSDLRFVSLRGLEARLAESNADGTDPSDEVRFMAGLQRLQFVLVYPEQGDIVVAGPAEGWRVDALGNVVGETSGRPVLMLDDFMAAFRSAIDRPGGGMSCSIDPTKEGLARVQQVARKLTAGDGPQQASRRIAEALGFQTVTVSGVPASSHFARSMVAADFRMKRLAMGFEPAPIDGMPSYLKLLGGRGGSGMQNMLPRWWLAPEYEPLLRDEKGLAWEIRGQGVQCLTEEDHVNAEGQRKRSGKASSAAQRWADSFTENFEELANHDSSFGQLRNAMDLAVVTTLIVHHGLAENVGLRTPWLSGKQELEELNTPKQVATQTTFIKQRGRWVISASGGVQILPGESLQNVETTPEMAVATDQAARIASETSWWWDAK